MSKNQVEIKGKLKSKSIIKFLELEKKNFVFKEFIRTQVDGNKKIILYAQLEKLRNIKKDNNENRIKISRFFSLFNKTCVILCI